MDKIVVVTRRTRLEELVDRFNTLPQAKFYIEHMGVDFSDYEREHEVFCSSARRVLHELDRLGRKVQRIDWTFLPNFIFGPGDAVVVLGRDGLVSNTAKYLHGQPIVGVNPDPERIDGVLLPFDPAMAAAGVSRVLEGKAVWHEITMAAVHLNDGQHLLAFNDFYLGQRTHVSSRYSLSWRGHTERQSSSGVLVSTGAGSTGWLSSTQNMAAAVSGLLMGEQAPRLPVLRLEWDDPRLAFVVREPFRSRSSDVKLSAGLIEASEELSFESHMPEGGVIFSDGVEADALAFNAGTVATVRAADRKALLVSSSPRRPLSGPSR
jgi:NAD kinase